jgi:hypothetical protein
MSAYIPSSHAWKRAAHIVGLIDRKDGEVQARSADCYLNVCRSGDCSEFRDVCLWRDTRSRIKEEPNCRIRKPRTNRDEAIATRYNDRWVGESRGICNGLLRVSVTSPNHECQGRRAHHKEDSKKDSTKTFHGEAS